MRPLSATSGRRSAAAPDDQLRSSVGNLSALDGHSNGGCLGGRHTEAYDQQFMDEYFRVVIRVRPPLERELSSPVWQNVVSVSSETQICLHEIIPESNAGDRASGTSQVVTNHSFTFDRVYNQDTSQPEVYINTARASVMSALQGYNATILAYGPTGTGKTYTMEGNHWTDDHCGGIIPRSMDDIFHTISQWKTPQSLFQVRASYLQIYNEIISDLLKPDRSHLVIREDKRKGVFVEGLSEWLCRSPEEVHTLMGHGSAARATAQTGANDASSRSHAVFMITVEHTETLGPAEPIASAPLPGSGGHRVQTGRLNLVDLAGSERPRITGATGQRLEETKKINQSLSALGNVISALTERRPRTHVPYRDSKLTRLLEDSLGGNCRTTMMAMVSPAAEAFGESLSTLKFAQRAKGVLNSPQVNEDVDQQTLIRKYETEIRKLRSELADRSRDPSYRHSWCANDLQGSQEFQHALAEQEGRIRSEYIGKFAELEKDRLGTDEDKAQVGRYKQLVLKQRDIMIALTQRLHERDESIIGLQAEIDARDRRAAELQERLERQSVRLAAAEKALHASSSVTAGPSGPLSPRQPQPVSLQTALPEAPASPKMADFLEFPRYLPECKISEINASSDSGAYASKTFSSSGTSNSTSYAGNGGAAETPKLLSPDDKVLELTSLLENQRQDNHRMALELENLRDAMFPGRSPAASVANALGSIDSEGGTRAKDFSTPSSGSALTRGIGNTSLTPAWMTPVPKGLSTAHAAAAAASAAAAEAAEIAKRASSPAPRAWEDSMNASLDLPRHGSTPRGRRSVAQEHSYLGSRPRASSVQSADKLPATPGSLGPSPSAPSTPSGRWSSGAGLSGARTASPGAAHSRPASPCRSTGPTRSSVGATGPSSMTLRRSRGDSRAGEDNYALPAGATGVGNSFGRDQLRRSVSAVLPPKAVPSLSPSLLGSGFGPVKATALAGGALAASEAVAAATAALNGSKVRNPMLYNSRPPSPSASASGPAVGRPCAAASTGASPAMPMFSAGSLREEAQRSVDALLARRRAELQGATANAAA
eukprot:TRINITY_DN104531_c0_g1_i1.p1 TRINITY_DN104531_c0_g1~~TRINITY_DN104531_c0_g1_i1.p1  ORF type:complete len:1055 (-),score=152.61 TRINITY_DN104531_c0_g1_i1:36-3200(-)